MVVTTKVFLDERHQKTDKTYPLKIRITVNRKHKEQSLGIFLLKEQWDSDNSRVKPSHPNAKLISLAITKKLNEVQQTALKYETTDKVYTAGDISGTTKVNNVSFQAFAQGEIDSMMAAGRVGNAITYRTATNRIIEYTGNKSLRFEQIDYRLLEAFTSKMLAEGITRNAIASYMREIRAIYNKAIKADVVEVKYYPFNKYKIKTTKTISRSLTIEQMKSIVSLNLTPGTPIWHSRNYFLLSFCLIGMNFTDMFLLTPASIQNGRLVYSRSKTKKVYSVYLHQVANQLLDLYKGSGTHYLLPVLVKGDSPLQVKKKALQAIKNTNEYLGRIAKECGIDTEITTYYARYTWANICKGLGYSKDLIAEALGHSYGNAVTGIYLDNYGNDVIDGANATIISTIFN
ncbi:MAG: site-specific integrase [Bacteroidetes bacterium]|nr:site-specific integrase [Bacteroidota bacterium]